MTEQQAADLGYRLSQGSYFGTRDDVAGRWYWIGRSVVDKRGGGFATKQEALDYLEDNLLPWPEEEAAQ